MKLFGYEITKPTNPTIVEVQFRNVILVGFVYDVDALSTKLNSHWKKLVDSKVLPVFEVQWWNIYGELYGKVKWEHLPETFVNILNIVCGNIDVQFTLKNGG